MTTRRMVAAGGLVLVVAAVLVALVVLGDDGGGARLEVVSPEGEVDYDYVIPEGTQDRIRAGEDVEIMPDRLDVTVGESIRIRNDDTEGVVAGIFYVGAGEEVQMRFSSPGELIGDCDVSASGQFVIDVRAA